MSLRLWSCPCHSVRSARPASAELDLWRIGRTSYVHVRCVPSSAHVSGWLSTRPADLTRLVVSPTVQAASVPPLLLVLRLARPLLLRLELSQLSPAASLEEAVRPPLPSGCTRSSGLTHELTRSPSWSIDSCLCSPDNTSTFGAAPAASGGFGAPQQPAQSGGLFGGGGGGFGTNTGASTAGFGSPAGGGLFGAPKTGFGATSGKCKAHVAPSHFPRVPRLIVFPSLFIPFPCTTSRCAW